MSPLAFDKQGKPFGWSRSTRQLRVRVFKNPSARGTCCQVHDGEGNPLYIDAETDYVTFRKLVGHSPGLYRLDQCDEDGVEVEDAQPAYVSLDLTRNTSMSNGDGGGDPNPLVIIEHMFAVHADVMKTTAAQQASLMAASAEILRAPIRPPLPPAEPKEREHDDDEIVEDEDDEKEELEPEDPWAAWRPYLKMVEPHLPKIGAFFYEQFTTYLKNTASPTPAAAPNVPAVSVPTVSSSPAAQGAVGPTSAVAGAPVTVETPASTQTSPHVPAPEVTAPVTTVTATSTVEASAPGEATTQVAAATPTDSAATAEGAPRNAMPMPTPAQMSHLYAIREELAPNERAIAERVMASMSSEMLVRWLGELTSLSVDDAVRAIRTTITELRTSKRSGA